MADHGVGVAAEVAKIIAPILGWSASAKKKSIAEYEAQVVIEKEAVESYHEEIAKESALS
jgi:hypothetical protein